MHLLGILFALAILVLLTKALLETVYGIILIAVGILLGAFGYTLKFGVWTTRSISKLWRMAFCY